MTDERKRELVEQWRKRAAQLERYAQQCRRAGDSTEAADADQAATDYWVEADTLEMSISA